MEEDDFIYQYGWADFLHWSFSCKSTVFTTQLDNVLQKSSSSPSSLIRLCCTQIIRNSKFIDISSLYFPYTLHNLLLVEAIRQDSEDTAEFFMSSWPDKILSITDVVPHPQEFYDKESDVLGIRVSQTPPEYSYIDLSHTLKVIMSVIKLFINIVKKRLTPKLRVLDLRGWVLHDKMVTLLCREIANLLNDNVLLLDDYHVVVECEFSENDICGHVANFLNRIRSNSQGAKINLHFRNLRMPNSTEDEIWLLFQQSDPTDLIGVAIPNFPNEFMAKVFEKVPNLIALKIIQGPSDPGQKLPLHLLPCLRRLELVDFTCLSTYIPESCLRQLEHLYIDLTQSIEIEIDVQFLISVPLCLRELYLTGHNIPSTNLHLWRELFFLLAPTLEILILQNYGEHDISFASIVNLMLPLLKLISLELVGYYTSTNSLHKCLPKLLWMPQLKKIALSYPYYDDGNYDDHSDVNEESAEKIARKAIEKMMLSGKLNPIKIDWRDGAGCWW